MPKQFIADLKDRDVVDSPFMVKEKTMAMAKNGKPYMNLKFMDKSGEIDGKLWDNVDELDKTFQKGDFVRIRGTASLYMGKMQLVAKEIKRLEEEGVDLADFVPVSPVPQAEMRAELAQVVASLSNPYLKALMEGFCGDTEFMAGYCKAPAAKGMHHVYIGGLLEHSLSVVRLVDAIVPLYPDLNRDLLVVGALLHDLGKVAELSYDRAFEYTDEGRLIGHISIGVELLTERIATVPGFPRELGMLLKHLLLSHHGQYEYGSPKRPKTVEATILHYLDDMDSKINGIRSHIARETAQGNRWTSHHRLYNLYFFTGNGMEDEGEQEMIALSEPLAEAAPSPAQVTAKPKQERPQFGNQPFGKLSNLTLFGESE
ncbi:3'-5' exoribonuclease YhaM family protein [Trichlorobacter lovleyi]|uniref:3'-5' exoribonuclease YhaM family protein n=1 Tax=Trichlorobacter lovleyi TaxID=313985 RepID=UPI0023F0DD0A|nr:HD domain-containing protein [Trichlorobacter lovleyi]